MDEPSDQPIVTVVIPTYNRPDFVRAAAASVLVQHVPAVECVVVDDAGSVPVVVPDDARVRVIRRERNGGPAAARNTGASAARGRYLAFLDDDDVYEPDRLELGLDGCARAPIGICWSAWTGAPAGVGRRLEGNVHDTILDALAPHIGCVTLRRDAFQPFDESYVASAELDWWLRMTTSLSVTTIDRVGVRLGRHDGARHGNTRRARIEASQQLLAARADYFSAHRRARAFRQFRVGVLAAQERDRRLAIRSFATSFATRPRLRPIGHLVRAALFPRRVGTDARLTASDPATGP